MTVIIIIWNFPLSLDIPSLSGIEQVFSDNCTDAYGYLEDLE